MIDWYKFWDVVVDISGIIIAIFILLAVLLGCVNYIRKHIKEPRP